jgi:hypothetical protein
VHRGEYESVQQAEGKESKAIAIGQSSKLIDSFGAVALNAHTHA